MRREMLWASLLGLPFGLIDYFLVPEYWHPESLFGLMKQYGVGIESFLFFSLMAGVVSVIYEFLADRKTKRIKGRRELHLLPLLLGAICFFGLTLFFPAKAIYNFMAAGLVGVLAVIWLRRDLLKQAVASALIFVLFYFVVLFLTFQIFAGVVTNFYNLENMWGILILGIPLEELAVAFFAGAFWSVLYEYVRSYREERLR